MVFSRGKIPCEILMVGEAPGKCITGDTLIETAYRDIKKFPLGVPIKSLVGKTGLKVYSYDITSGKLVIGNVKRVWTTGIRDVYRVTYDWWGAPPDGKGGRQLYKNSITVTSNHPFLLTDNEYKSLDTGLAIGDSLKPFYRSFGEYCMVGTFHKTMRKEHIFLMEHYKGKVLDGVKEQVHHKDRNKWNNTLDNLEIMNAADHARLHGYEDNAMFKEEHKETHRKVMESQEYRDKQSEIMKKVLADPETYARRIKQIHAQKERTSATLKEKYKDPIFYFNYLKSRVVRGGKKLTEDQIRNKFQQKFPDYDFPPEGNHRIISIEKVGRELVYDMSVDKYNNFAANDIFIHNSEDTLGSPFVGPAGQLLDQIISRSIPDETRYALTNLVCCIPLDENNDKISEPPIEAISACKPRLEEFISLCNPSIIVAIGRLARDHLKQGYMLSTRIPKGTILVDIIHPAYILRANIAQRGLEVQKCIATIKGAIEDLADRKEEESLKNSNKKV